MSGTNPSKQLTPEERAALERRLAELRRLQQQQQHHMDASSPSPNGGGGSSWEDDVAPEDLHDDEDEDDGGEEAFLQEMERTAAARVEPERFHTVTFPSASVPPARGGGGGGNNIHNSSGGNGGGNSASSPAGGSGGEHFGLFLFAKMGDKESFEGYRRRHGVDVRALLDNDGRNALHYAVDGGSEALVTALLAAGVPYVAAADSAKGITPLDVARLCDHEEPALLAALEEAAAAAGLRDGAAAAREEAIARFAPDPPKFVLSAPGPADAAAVQRPRRLWGAPAAAASPPAGVSVQLVPKDPAAPEALAAAVVACGAPEAGLAHYVQPAEAPLLAGLWPRLTAAQATTGEGTDRPCGTALALSFGGRVQFGGAAKAAAALEGVAVVGGVAVAEAQRGKGVAAAMVRALEAAAAQEAPAPPGVVLFAADAPLPPPCTMLCMAKWYRKGIDAAAVLARGAGASAAAAELFPDYAHYDQVLCADCVLRGAVPASLREKHASALEGWSLVDPAHPAQVEAVLAFLTAKAAASGAEVAYVPTSAEELQTGLLAPGLKAFVRVDAASVAVVDFIVLRLREPREAPSSSTAAAPLVVAQLVYALFTSLTGTAKSEHIALICQLLLQAQVVLVPVMFGITEGDVAKANYEELRSHRLFVYGKTKAGMMKKTPAAKVSVPVFLL